MAIFTIGDLHLSLGTSKPMDIFSGWENYVERLRENWLAAVGPQDTVVLAGDIVYFDFKMEQTGLFLSRFY